MISHRVACAIAFAMLTLAALGYDAARSAPSSPAFGGSRITVVPVAIQRTLPASRVSIVLASFYGRGERLNRHTANGERFNPNALTAAHRSFPFGTRLRVTYRGRSTVVRVNDRGPAKWTGRSLDLSYGAAKALGMVRAGIGHVTVEVVR